ncbi:hypothetical protein BJ875DRAFT_463306 [Amylocarpus encephaloides]|uniref:CST complex subunit Stn1 N-terminal domain-containing protein n=1 Tax=Amylocarpus encephaloides TaxID=45428 RepID=A0A9P8C518_9HELO|nr:hypothetical protein BJ875DRAFT_463306 [Amylocarpus encephaloides]
MTSGVSTPHIYPEYCHDLSPSVKKWCPLQVVDVHRLDDRGMYSNGRRLYHHGNHPIKWVRLTGLVVAVDEFYGRRVFTLDDSSGSCIECTSPAPPKTIRPGLTNLATSVGAETKTNAENQAPNTRPSVSNPTVPWELVDVGAVVKVKGVITIFREQKQVEMIKVDILRSIDQEVRCWNESLQFRREILETPWVVSQEQEEKCRRRARRGMARERKAKKTTKGRS